MEEPTTLKTNPETSSKVASESNTPEQPAGSLELGDIIEIRAPSNTEIHDQIYAITYIDSAIIRLANVSTFQTLVLYMDDNGKFTDESIRQISVLCRCKEKGFAKQHGLLTSQWVDIHFGGEVPTIISGEITNLEEDMIEVTTYPDRNVIYIDFEYKGIPEHIPIDKFVLRDRPESLGRITSIARATDEEGEAVEVGEDTEAYMEYADTGEAILHIPDSAQPKPTTTELLRSLYVDAADIIEEDIEDAIQMVEVPDSEKRYTIEAQLIDMTDEFISGIPVLERTPRVFARLHNLLHKFRQLREQFSIIDSTGNVVSPKITGAYHKPLADIIPKLESRLRWLLPVVQTTKRLYTYADEPLILQPDADTSKPIHTEISTLSQIQQNYNKHAERLRPYESMLQQLMEELQSFQSPTFSNEVLLKDQPVKAEIEAVVHNMDDFYSTSLHNEAEARRRFHIQRYGLGNTKMVSDEIRTGRKSYIRQPLVSNDKMNIRSLLVLPEQCVQYSRVELPGTKIADRVMLSQQSLDLFRILKSKTAIETIQVSDLTKEMEYGGLTKNTTPNQETNAAAAAAEEPSTFLGSRYRVKEYVLSPEVDMNTHSFSQFLNTILPKKRILIEFAKHRIQGPLSLFDMIRILEPFMIYTTDITFTHYKEIRYFVKEQIKKYKAEMKKNETAFQLLVNTKYEIMPSTNNINVMLQSDVRLDSDFRSAYHLSVASSNADPREENGATKLPITEFPSELLHQIYSLDGGKMYLHLINKLLISLITPDKILQSVELAKLDDMTNMEKIRATDCYRRYIVKRYTSMEALRKDNNTEEVFYDKEYDDTPYDLLKKYKDKKREMLPELFFDFFREVLISKHDCPESMASDLAQTILLGKKHVKEGYAILELRPTLNDADNDEAKLTPKEQQQIRIEAEARKRIQYYKRVNNHWVRDDSVDETSFVDSSTLLCDMSQECIQTTPSKVCAPTDTAAMRMKVATLKRMQKEFDHRVSMSLEDIQRELDTTIQTLNDSVRRKRILYSILDQKHNDYAVALGKRVVRVEEIESPYEPLRKMIMSQTDFVKRQTDIMRFVENYAREPMIDKGEDQYWLYCTESNTKLFPLSMYLLAKSFVETDTYNETLDQICAQYGELSSDGDCIVDKHTYYVLRQIDFVEEEGYDESGFRIVSNKIMEKEVGEAIAEALSKPDKVFESTEPQYIYNVFITLATHIGIKSGAILDEIEDSVLRITMEIMNDHEIVLSEKSYLKMAEKRAKGGKEKQVIPYAIYRNQILIMATAALTMISLMTLVPSFKTKKTFPGCVQSFTGFPVDSGEEDTSGLKYVACIVHQSKSSIVPWNAIEPLSTNTLLKRMKDFITTYLLKRDDIRRLCDMKREYLEVYPDDVIPATLNVAKWVHFHPPLVNFHIVKSLHGVGQDFRDELMRAIRDGHRSQTESIGILRTKIEKHVYGIVEMIRTIVSQKDMLLTTASREPFLENACCNEGAVHPLSYFIKEDGTIQTYIQKIGSMSELLRQTMELTKPAIMFHRENTAIERGELLSELDEPIIYGAMIHYCNFDRDIPIPPELESVCNEKPAVYNRMDSLDAKIEKMKANGKRYTKTHLEQLMRIVNRQNQVSIYYGVSVEEASQINMFKDILEHLDLNDSEIVDASLRKLLWTSLGDYNPAVMVNEPRESAEQLNRYLRRANGQMYSKITEFLDQYGNLPNAQYDEIQVFIHEICAWKTDTPTDTKSVFAVRQFIVNAMESMVKVFPQFVLSKNSIPTLTMKHWGLSLQHHYNLDITIYRYYNWLRQFTGNENRSLSALLENIYVKLTTLLIFVKKLPIFTPIVKDGVEYHSLYNKESVYLLLKYALYSVLYEYIIGAEDPDVLEIDRKEQISERRQQTREREESNFASAYTENVDDIPLMEVELELGNIRKVKETTGTFLVNMLMVLMDNKSMVNLTYDDIRFKTQRAREKEKKQITDAFERMERDERKVEDMLKQFKIGRWNIGMQKSLFQYNAETYGRQQTLNAYLNAEETAADEEEIQLHMGEADPTTDIDIGVEDIEREEAIEVEREYDMEANDIGGLDEDYMDGHYYEEDMGDEF
jgi:hypothetical protein